MDPDPPAAPTDSLQLEDRIVAAIRQIIRAVDLHSRRLVDHYGLTGPQLATLQEASRLGPVSTSALARAVHLSQPTLTGIVARLEKRGLVTRTRGTADRRTVTVTPTDAGHAMLAQAPSLLQDRFQAELGRVAEWERTLILSVLQRVAGMMDADGLDAAPHLAVGQAITDGQDALDAVIAPLDLPVSPPRPPAPEATPPSAARDARPRRSRAPERRAPPSPPSGAS